MGSLLYFCECVLEGLAPGLRLYAIRVAPGTASSEMLRDVHPIPGRRGGSRRVF